MKDSSWYSPCEEGGEGIWVLRDDSVHGFSRRAAAGGTFNIQHTLFRAPPLYYQRSCRFGFYRLWLVSQVWDEWFVGESLRPMQLIADRCSFLFKPFK